MSNPRNVAIWTDNDLDGSGSAYLLSCIYKTPPHNVLIKEVYDRTFVGEFKGWVAANYDKYDTIFITDLHIPDELVDIVDDPKVVIIDHHQTHVDVKDRYKKAKVIIEYETSCTKLIRRKFEAVLKLTDAQKELLDHVDDYDNYTLKLKDTLKYNAIYHSYNRPKVDKFIENFRDGVREFTPNEKNAIKLHFLKYKEQIDKATFYFGNIKGYKVVGCFAENSINEVAHYAINHFKADIAMVIILQAKSVSIRKNKETCPIELHKLAEKLCDGGGHAYAAGGKITEKFMEFLKTLTAQQS